MLPEEDISPDVRSTLEAMGGKKKEGYGLVGRLIFFVIVTVVIVAICAAVFVPFAIGVSMTAGGGGGNSPLALIPVIAVISIAVTGFFNFKK